MDLNCVFKLIRSWKRPRKGIQIIVITCLDIVYVFIDLDKLSNINVINL